MNIPELTHHASLTFPFSHYPTFVITPQTKRYYFYSKEQKTLRKKTVNTHLTQFMAPQQQQDCYYFILRQVDYGREHICGESLVTVTKLSKKNIILREDKQLKEDELMRVNRLKPEDYEKVTLIRIPHGQKTELWTMFYSQNIVKCQAPITEHLKQHLTAYCGQIKQILEERLLHEKDKVRQFELIFEWNKSQGRIKLLFIQQIKLKQQNSKSRELYRTDFKLGTDDYERFQLAIHDQSPSAAKQIQHKEVIYQDKRIKYLNFLKKIANDSNRPIHGLSHQKINPNIIKQYTCAACRNLVVLKQGQPERTVTMNRIPEIQMKRQVKMKSKVSINYDLVSICQSCYDSFVQLFKLNEIINTRGNKKAKPQNIKKQATARSSFIKGESQKKSLDMVIEKMQRGSDIGTQQSENKILSFQRWPKSCNRTRTQSEKRKYSVIEKTAGTRKNEFWNCEKTNNTIDDVSKNEATIQCDNILSEIGEYEKGSSSQKCSYFKFKKHRLAF